MGCDSSWMPAKSKSLGILHGSAMTLSRGRPVTAACDRVVLMLAGLPLTLEEPARYTASPTLGRAAHITPHFRTCPAGSRPGAQCWRPPFVLGGVAELRCVVKLQRSPQCIGDVALAAALRPCRGGAIAVRTRQLKARGRRASTLESRAGRVDSCRIILPGVDQPT